MAITKLNSLAIPANTVVAADLSYPLTNFSSTGIDDNADPTAITIDSSERVGIGTTQPESSLQVSGEIDDTPSSKGVHLGMTANYANMQLASASDTGGFIDFTSADGTNYDGRIIYRHSSNRMEFATNAVSTPKVSILSSGGITFNGDTADANALDDYEEGTCTLSLTSSGTAPTVSYTNQTAYYVKVGKVVTVSWYSGGLNISNAGSGTAKIAGLPYSASTASSHYPVANVTHNTATGQAVDSGYAYASEIHLMQSGLTTNLAEWTSGNPKYIMVTITYRTT